MCERVNVSLVTHIHIYNPIILGAIRAYHVLSVSYGHFPCLCQSGYGAWDTSSVSDRVSVLQR